MSGKNGLGALKEFLSKLEKRCTGCTFPPVMRVDKHFQDVQQCTEMYELVHSSYIHCTRLKKEKSVLLSGLTDFVHPVHHFRQFYYILFSILKVRFYYETSDYSDSSINNWCGNCGSAHFTFKEKDGSQIADDFLGTLRR